MKETLLDMLRQVVAGREYEIEVNIKKPNVKKRSKKPESLPIYVGDKQL